MKAKETTESDNHIDNNINNKNNIYDTVHCIFPSCKQIPSIQMDLFGHVTFQCSCCQKETYSINDFINKLINSSQSFSNNLCVFKHHISDNIKGILFCAKCKCWLCDKCIIEHNNYEPLKVHKLSTWEIDNQCEQHEKNKYKKFCEMCNEHLCKECKNSKKHSNHKKSIISLESYIDSEEIEYKDELYTNMSNWLNKVKIIKRNICNFLNDIQNKIEQSFNTFSNYYTLCQMIHNTFSIFSKNYFSIKNIISNYDIASQIYNNCKFNDINDLINNQTFTIKEIETFISVISSFTNDENNKIISSIYNIDLSNSNENPENQSLFSNIPSISCSKSLFNRVLFDDSSIKKFTPVITYQNSHSLIHDDITITSIILLQDQRICVSSIEKIIEVYTIRLNNITRDISKEDAHNGMIYSLCQMQNSNLVSSSYGDIKIWSIERNDLSLKLNINIFNEEGFFKVIELPDMKIAACTMNKEIKIWNLNILNNNAKQPILTLTGHVSCIKSILYNKNQNALISASTTLDDDNGRIIKWDLNNTNNNTCIDNVDCSNWNSLIEIQENVYAIGGRTSIVIADFNCVNITSTLYGPDDKQFDGEDDIILVQYGQFSKERGTFIAQTTGMICLYEFNNENNQWLNVFYTKDEYKNEIYGNGLLIYKMKDKSSEQEDKEIKYLISSSKKGLKFWKIETTNDY